VAGERGGCREKGEIGLREAGVLGGLVPGRRRGKRGVTEVRKELGGGSREGV